MGVWWKATLIFNEINRYIQWRGWAGAWLHISKGCQRGRTSSWESLQLAGTCGWKCLTLTPRQLLKFKQMDQNHLPRTWNSGSSIFEARKHKSQGQGFLSKDDICLSFHSDLASVHHSRINLIRYSTLTVQCRVPFTFSAKDFSMHTAQFQGGIGGWWLTATMGSIGLHVIRYVMGICHLFWQLNIFFCWEMYISLCSSMMEDVQIFSFPASPAVKAQAYHLGFPSQMQLLWM